MLNILYTYIQNIYDLVWLDFMAYQPLQVIQYQILFIHIYLIYMIWLGWVLWHINPWWLFNAQTSLYIYIECIWFGWVSWHINPCGSLNAKSSLYIYIKYIGFVNMLLITFLNESRLIFCRQLNGSNNCYVTQKNPLNISHLFTHSFNNQTVLFQTIQFSICYLFAFSLNLKQFYLTHR